MTEKRIYLDFNASTPLDPEVLEAPRTGLVRYFVPPES
jgi:cysteine sulfinate desulfinase/cysteine desulfurase-like protein